MEHGAGVGDVDPFLFWQSSPSLWKYTSLSGGRISAGADVFVFSACRLLSGDGFFFSVYFGLAERSEL